MLTLSVEIRNGYLEKRKREREGGREGEREREWEEGGREGLKGGDGWKEGESDGRKRGRERDELSHARNWMVLAFPSRGQSIHSMLCMYV